MIEKYRFFFSFFFKRIYTLAEYVLEMEMLRERFRFYFVFQVSGHLYNTGQFLVFRADREAKVRVNITGGPLAYHYQFEEIYIHYGMDNDHGSEHRINNYAFPAEVSEMIDILDLFFLFSLSPFPWKLRSLEKRGCIDLRFFGILRLNKDNYILFDFSKFKKIFF